MSLTKIVRFTLSLLLAVPFNLNAQEKTVNVDWERGIRLGCDLSRFALSTFQPERKGIEFSIDTEWKRNLFVTAEVGAEKVSDKSNRIDYTSNGFYGRIGIDHNIFARHDNPQSKDIVYVGVRYGFYSVTQRTDSYFIPEGYWGNTSGSLATETLTGHWIEGVFGVKVELLKNMFLGLSARGRFLIFSQKNLNYPDYMPGFGDGSNKFNYGLNYSVYYQLPLMKVKAKPVEKKNVKGAKNVKK